MIDVHTCTTPDRRKVSIVLEELGLPYRAIAIGIDAREQSAIAKRPAVQRGYDVPKRVSAIPLPA